MGRKGNKRRGKVPGQEQVETVNRKKRRVDVSSFAVGRALLNNGKEDEVTPVAESAGAGDMPWTRWKDELEDPKQEHLQLAAWKEESYTNAMFEEYYRTQGNVQPKEWPDFLAALRTPLPATFRLNPQHSAGARLLRRLQAGEFDMPPSSSSDGKALRSWRWRGKQIPYTIKQVRGVPRREAWQFGFDRAGFRAARKFAVLARLYAEMHSAEASGAAARQEVVSMLPALLLHPEPGDKVLDMCASPGSKTVQLLEAVRPCVDQGDAAIAGDPGTRKPVLDARAYPHKGGLVVANDADREERVPLLCARLASRPAHERAGLVITAAPGELLPMPSFPAACAGAARGTLRESEPAPTPAGQQKKKARKAAGGKAEGAQLQVQGDEQRSEVQGFSGVLVDAPCSGDGTIRKAADILRRWTPSTGLALHGTQLKLLRNALAVARVGGTVVYSTCSFNPVENEAVVAGALGELPAGCCVLRDVRAAMAGMFGEEEGDEEDSGTEAQGSEERGKRSPSCNPRLRLREGLRAWKVADEGGEGEGLRWHRTLRDAKQAGMRPTPLPTMWPPKPGSAGSPTSNLHLERCARLLPQDNDTGGFFLALIHKTSPLPPDSAAPPSTAAAASPTRVASPDDLQPVGAVNPAARARCKLQLGKLAAAAGSKGRRQALLDRVWAAGDGSTAAIAPEGIAWLHADSEGVAVVQAGLSVAEAVEALASTGDCQY